MQLPDDLVDVERGMEHPVHLEKGPILLVEVSRIF